MNCPLGFQKRWFTERFSSVSAQQEHQAQSTSTKHLQEQGQKCLRPRVRVSEAKSKDKVKPQAFKVTAKVMVARAQA